MAPTVPVYEQPRGSYGAYGASPFQTAAAYPTYQNQEKHQVIIIGSCPACRVGTMEENFTPMGLCCAICCFPCGLVWCFLMKKITCTYCGARFN